MLRPYVQLKLQTRCVRNRYRAIATFPHTTLRATGSQAETRNDAIAEALHCPKVTLASDSVERAIKHAEQHGVPVTLILRGESLHLPPQR